MTENKFGEKTHEHGLVGYQPKDKKQLERLSAAVNEFNINMPLLFERFGTVGAMYNGLTDEMVMTLAQRKLPPMLGVCFCPGCFEAALVHLDDVRSFVLDLKKMYNTAAEDEKVKV